MQSPTEEVDSINEDLVSGHPVMHFWGFDWGVSKRPCQGWPAPPQRRFPPPFPGFIDPSHAQLDAGLIRPALLGEDFHGWVRSLPRASCCRRGQQVVSGVVARDQKTKSEM